MRQRFRYIFRGLLIVISGFLIFRYLNSNGRILPFKISNSKPHPEISNYQVINFERFTMNLPNGWKDKGFIVGEEGEIRGEVKKARKILVYEYGITATPSTLTLHEYLFQARNYDMIMGDEIIVERTDSTISVRHVYPVSPETSDTVKTGQLTDSILDLYPPIKVPKVLLGEPNYYSLTRYNDSIYFIPIEVPKKISNSEITNFDSLRYNYNLVRPKNRERGYTKINIAADGFLPFALWGEDLDFTEQEILIRAGLSVRFNNNYRIGGQLYFEQGE